MTPGSRQANEWSRSRPKESFIEISDARLRYRDEGRGPTVVFIHGWTLDLDLWEFQASALSTHFRVVRLDRRGFGLSSGRPSLAQDVLDIGALCRRLEIERTAVVGMSQGARVALQLAIAPPLPISCWVLDGVPEVPLPGAIANAADLPYEHYRGIARREGMAAFRLEWAQHPLATLRTHNARAHEILATMIERYPGHDLLSPEINAPSGTNYDAFNAVMPPLLIVNGEYDLDSRRRYAQRLSSRLDHCERIEIPDAGHLCSLDNPQMYTAALRRFLDTHAT